MSYSGNRKVITHGRDLILATTIVILKKPNAYRSISFFEGSGDVQDQLIALSESIKNGFEITRIEDNHGNLIRPKWQ